MKKKNKLTKINDKTKIKNSDISLKKIKQKKLIQKYLKWVNDKTITKFTELKKSILNFIMASFPLIKLSQS